MVSEWNGHIKIERWDLPGFLIEISKDSAGFMVIKTKGREIKGRYDIEGAVVEQIDVNHEGLHSDMGANGRALKPIPYATVKLSLAGRAEPIRIPFAKITITPLIAVQAPRI